MRSSLALIVAAGVWLQSAAPTRTPQAPAFKGRVDLVTLDVSVWDRDGRPVKGLKPADFTLLEDAKPREIVSVSEIDIPEPPPPTATWMREASVDVESNDVTDKRLFLILLDDASFGNATMFPIRLEQLKDAARRVIRRLGPTDLAAIVFTGDNRRSQDFTADHGRLLAAVNQMTGVSMPGSLAASYAVSVLERAVGALIGVPGRRKAVIDITGFGAGWVGGLLLTRTEVMFEKAQRAGVNVYTIGPQSTLDPDYWEDSWFRRVAKETGGEWFGDLFVEPGVAERAVERIFTANSSYYMLGYTSADLAKFHNVKVLVDRPDVTVRSREKYYWPAPEPKKPAVEPPPLAKGIVEILPNTGIPMRAVAMPFATPDGDGATIAVVTHLRVKPQPDARDPDETFAVATHLFTSEGAARGSKSRTEQVTHTGRDMIVESLSAVTASKPGLYQVRMAAHRPAANLHGGVYVTVDVPDFAKRAVSFSGVLVSLAEWPSIGVRDSMANLLPAEPTTSRAFSLLDRVHAYVRVYQAKGKRPVAVPVRTRIVDDHDRVVLDRTEPLEPGRFTAATRGADVRVELPTATLPPGAYLLTFDAELGDTTARRELRFTVRAR